VKKQDSPTPSKKVQVTSQGQTVVSARELLKSERVQEFIKVFGPKVKQSISEAKKNDTETRDR